MAQQNPGLGLQPLIFVSQSVLHETADTALCMMDSEPYHEPYHVGRGSAVDLRVIDRCRLFRADGTELAGERGDASRRPGSALPAGTGSSRVP
jgi:hypothetical protein